jgi:hypothetical protein
MTRPDEVWIPLVDEPIGTIVAQIQAEQAEIGELVDSPQRLLAFKTFAYIRVGLVLGELLVENDIEPYNARDLDRAVAQQSEYRARVVEEVQAVAEEVARDIPPDAPLGPDEAARERFRDFARRRLELS